MVTVDNDIYSSALWSNPLYCNSYTHVNYVVDIAVVVVVIVIVNFLKTAVDAVAAVVTDFFAPAQL